MWKLLDRLEKIGVALVSFDGKILQCNSEFARIQGDDMTHLVGRNVVDLTATEDRERASLNLSRLSSGDSDSITHDKKYISRSGDMVSCRCQFIANRSKRSSCIVAFVFEFDPGDSQKLRILRLESQIEKLMSVIALTNGVSIKMSNSNTNANTQNDSSVKATADNGSNLQLTTNSTKSMMIVVVTLIAVLGIAAVGIAAFVYGGRMSLGNGDSHIQIDSEPAGRAQKNPSQE